MWKLKQNNIQNRYGALIGLSVALIIFSSKTAFCDEIAELKAQMQAIEQENKALQEQLNKQREVTQRLIEKINALEKKDEVLSSETKSAKEKSVGHVSEEHAELPVLTDIPKLNIKGFSDLRFKARFTDDEDSNTFALGEVNLFITSEISDKVSFLSEAVFYPEIETDEPGFELENHPDFELQRVALRYSLSDLFNIDIGRMHTPLGYWNHAYHHGVWLQTTVLRPEIYRFEYDGGVLPVHSVGIQFSGVKEFDAFKLGYHLSVLNGRGRTIDEVQNFNDENASKAISTLLSLRPHSVEGLQLGTTIYVDKIPPDPDNPTRTDSIAEWIVGGHVVYAHDKFEFLGELFKIHHNDKASGNEFNTLGFYLQGGYRIDKLTPYYRFDFINFGDGDPYLIPSQIDISKHTLGLRWDILTWNALKFEYGFTDQKDQENEHSIIVDSSFAF